MSSIDLRGYLGGSCGSCLSGVIWLINLLIIQPPSDPLKNLPGPNGGALQNHFRDIMDPKLSPETHERWVKSYGKTFRFHGFGRHDYRLMSFDFRVISHVLSSTVYEKPWQTRTLLARLIGRGIFSMEGPEHKLQRKLIGPAFSTQTVKSMTPIFFSKAEELRDRWDGLVSDPSLAAASEPAYPDPTFTSTEKPGNVIIDIAHWFSRASFDVIGLAGFDYHFHALQDETEEVYLAYRRMFNVTDKGPGLKGLLGLYFPLLERLWPDEGGRITRASLKVIDRAGKKLVANKKEAILAETANGQDVTGKDILSLLIKSNLSADPSKRLSDSDLLDQCSTFLLAGSDSVSTATSWCLHLLSTHPEIQARLRDEITSMSASATSLHPPTKVSELKRMNSVDSGFAETFESNESAAQSHTEWEALEGLPLLDAVVRETLRLCPPVHGTIRVATEDDRIPITEPVTLRDGTVVQKGEYLSIRKGSYIHVPIEGLNFSEEIWGSDAREFNPDRWTNLPEKARSPTHPGLGNVMTFGFGPHSCLGHKFTVAEMKVFLATVLPEFTFSPVQGIQISKFNAILTRPYVANKWELGTRLPVSVARFTPA
ncbi:cytochrome P450 [Infundibulicybe gibba]|nr:cytochrome P450 [Infundibulicybe gibba]